MRRALSHEQTAGFTQRPGVLERQSRLSGSNPQMAWQQLNEGLNHLFPATSGNKLRRSASRPSLTDTSMMMAEQDRESTSLCSSPPPDVYHTVHGARRKTILASRRNEPFSKIIRRPAGSGEVDRVLATTSSLQQYNLHLKDQQQPSVQQPQRLEVSLGVRLGRTSATGWSDTRVGCKQTARGCDSCRRRGKTGFMPEDGIILTFS